ncbi:hypothetical protein GGR53DRAFT_465026 [Hypoxylon sp. FL1150]|nr:hypothetical protein GGR53DRAFT_465026 [Hypoxylon sp. FL1150]
MSDDRRHRYRTHTTSSSSHRHTSACKRYRVTHPGSGCVCGRGHSSPQNVYGQPTSQASYGDDSFASPSDSKVSAADFHDGFGMTTNPASTFSHQPSILDSSNVVTGHQYPLYSAASSATVTYSLPPANYYSHPTDPYSRFEEPPSYLTTLTSTPPASSHPSNDYPAAASDSLLSHSFSPAGHISSSTGDVMLMTSPPIDLGTWNDDSGMEGNLLFDHAPDPDVPCEKHRANSRDSSSSTDALQGSVADPTGQNDQGDVMEPGRQQYRSSQNDLRDNTLYGYVHGDGPWSAQGPYRFRASPMNDDYVDEDEENESTVDDRIEY